jgi:hypothetical protein
MASEKVFCNGMDVGFFSLKGLLVLSIYRHEWLPRRRGNRCEIDHLFFTRALLFLFLLKHFAQVFWATFFLVQVFLAAENFGSKRNDVIFPHVES